MKLKEDIEWLNALKRELITNKLTAVILALTLAIAVFLYMDRETKVIYGPPTPLQKPIEITNARVMDVEWARFFAQVIMNFSPDDLDRRKEMLLPFVAPTFRSGFIAMMDKAKEDAVQFGIYQLFKEEKVEIGKNGEVYIRGSIRRYVRGKAPVTDEVEVVMKVIGGKIYDFKVASVNPYQR